MPVPLALAFGIAAFGIAEFDISGGVGNAGPTLGTLRTFVLEQLPVAFPLSLARGNEISRYRVTMPSMVETIELDDRGHVRLLENSEVLATVEGPNTERFLRLALDAAFGEEDASGHVALARMGHLWEGELLLATFHLDVDLDLVGLSAGVPTVDARSIRVVGMTGLADEFLGATLAWRSAIATPAFPIRLGAPSVRLVLEDAKHARNVLRGIVTLQASLSPLALRGSDRTRVSVSFSDQRGARPHRRVFDVIASAEAGFERWSAKDLTIDWKEYTDAWRGDLEIQLGRSEEVQDVDRATITLGDHESPFSVQASDNLKALPTTAVLSPSLAPSAARILR